LLSGFGKSVYKNISLSGMWAEYCQGLDIRISLERKKEMQLFDWSKRPLGDFKS